MGWIYFQESVGLAGLSIDGSAPSPIARVTDIARVSYCLECDRATLHPPRSVTMCEMSAQRCSIGPGWTLSTEASLARTYRAQDAEQAWTESEAAFIGSCTDLWQKSIQTSFSSKTSQPLGPVGLEKWSGHLPISGMTVDGRVFQPKSLEPRTSGGAGSSWPTPKATDGSKGGPNQTLGGLPSLSALAAKSSQTGGQLNPTWVEWLMGYPSGWTVLEDWATLWFRPKRGKPSGGY
jgi:hypothetical protein